MSTQDRPPRRPGFTLIELLVVVAIIAILMMLLLPAIQRVREAANKVRCSSNLSQIALAVHMYHHDHQRLPTGGARCCQPVLYTNGIPNNPPFQNAGWAFQILPYIEQETIYRNTDYWGTVAPALIPIYFCPSRRAPTRSPLNRGLLDYGAALPGRWAWDYETFNFHPSQQTGLFLRSDGVTRSPAWDVKVTLSQGSIPDGTSNVIMISENWKRPSRYSVGDWHDDYGYTDGWDADIGRLSSFQPERDADSIPYLPSSAWGYQFGSAHTATFNCVWADRSVRPVKYSVNLDTFNRLCDRRDGAVINMSDL
jgi:prepilin-type N-terminal cleavage/methylation domain-containing protein